MRGKIPPLQSSETADTLILVVSPLEVYERIHFHSVKPLSLGDLVMAALGDEFRDNFRFCCNTAASSLLTLSGLSL